MGNLAYAGKSALWGWRDLEAMDPKKQNLNCFCCRCVLPANIAPALHASNTKICTYIWEHILYGSYKPGLHGVESQGNDERCSTPLPAHLLTCIRHLKKTIEMLIDEFQPPIACSYILIRQALYSYHERWIVPSWFQHCLQPHGDGGSKNIGGNSVLT